MQDESSSIPIRLTSRPADSQALESPLVEQPETMLELPPPPSSSSRWRWAIFGIVTVLLIAGSILVWTFRNLNSLAPQMQAQNFETVSIPLAKLAASSLANSAETLKINGNLQIASSLTLTPSPQPGTAVAGQMYYDQTANLLAYYNGQQFINLDGGGDVTNTTNVTNITNTTLGAGGSAVTPPPGVQLQTTAPGVQQAGNFNIAGIGSVGILKTAVIDSSGEAFYINPSAPSASSGQITPGAPAKLGLATIGSSVAGPGLNGYPIATKFTMGDTGGTATSIAVYLGSGSSAQHIQVALYDDDGDIPSRPAGLLANSAIVTLTPNAFNTITIPSAGLTAGATYWLAFNTDDSSLTRVYNSGNKTSCFYGLGFGFMPDPFAPGPCFFSDETYTIYANYTTSSGAGGTLGKAPFTLSPTGQVILQNSTDSGTAFQVQNASGTTTIFNIDTANGRIAIGKSAAAYKLDIAAGDINLSNNRSIRFSGIQTLGVNAAGTTTSLSNFSSGGRVVAQAANFIVQDANGTHHNLEMGNDGSAIFSNASNSATGFQVQNAAGTPLLRADTTGMRLFVGNPDGDANPVVLYLANKDTVDDPVGAQGGTYYNRTLQSFRCYYSDAWHNCADAEPQHSFSVYDEFIGGQTSFTGAIGSLGWNALAIGANGSLALNPTTPTPSAARPGVLRLRTPAVINQGTTLLLGDASGGSTIIAKDNNLKTAVAMGAATGQVMRIGLHDETNTTTQPLSGVWWEANPGLSPDWRYCYGDGTTATCAASTVSLTANTWVTLELRVTATGNGTSSAVFVINNTPYQVSASTIDTTNRVSPVLNCYATTGTAQDCFWDYFQFTGTTSIAR